MRVFYRRLQQCRHFIKDESYDERKVPVDENDRLDNRWRIFGQPCFCHYCIRGLYPNPLLLTMIVSNYLFKTVIEIIFTPCTYAAVRFFKKHDHIDTYDYGVRYNPLPE